MNKIYFNWDELNQHAKKDPAGILILTYCLLVGPNNVIALYNWVKHTLGVSYIPPVLFSKGFIICRKYKHNRKNYFITKYKCNVPTSYFTNPSFFNTDITLQQKVDYLQILSQRPSNSNLTYVLDYAVDEHLWNNPLVVHKDGKLYLIPEYTMDLG